MTDNLTPVMDADPIDDIGVPSPQPKTMDFPEAMRQVLDGKKVSRVSWGNKDYGFLKDEWLSIFTKDSFHTWLVSLGDMEAEDWIVYTEVS
jgi:hypothetical protein